jgi:hypothetical protein
LLLAGPRGVGKTVTVSTVETLAQDRGFEVVSLQAVSGREGLVESLLREARDRLAAEAGAWQRARWALERIGGASLSVAGIGASISTTSDEPVVPGISANTLATALATLAEEVRKDAKTGGLLITIDELQVVPGPDLALLAAALHRLNVNHTLAPVVFASTGLPAISEAMRQAGVTHPDRLFVLEPIPLTLDEADARYAVAEPARKAGVTWAPEAAEALVVASNGYPAHLQLFAHVTWTHTAGPDAITLADVNTAMPEVAATLERRTFGPRWARMTDRQSEFMAALATHHGHASVAAIAHTLDRDQRDLYWIREQLIDEGDVFVPRRGQLTMSVPLFAAYILDHYEDTRVDAATSLISLRKMTTRVRTADPTHKPALDKAP